MNNNNYGVVNPYGAYSNFSANPINESFDKNPVDESGKIYQSAVDSGNNTKNVTSIAELQKYAFGNIVKLPDFGEEQPFVARLKRPSLLALAASGKIPNSLLTAAGELFNGSGRIDADNENAMSELYNVCHIICESALVEPTLEDIENVGLSLSDEQMIAIFNYTQQGVKALEPFRQE